MTDNGSNGSTTSHTTARPQVQERRRASLPLIILALLFVIVPFLTWYLTWFGRPLTDENMESYLKDEQNVRHVQQALTQIEGRIEKGDASVKRWYPLVIALTNSKVVEIRKTVAWVLGQDNSSEEFHSALLKLLGDMSPAVRRNAAVQLVRFQDTSGRQEIRAILEPYRINSPVGGTVSSILKEGSEVRENALVARVASGPSEVAEIRSPLQGKIASVGVREGAAVAAGDNLLSIAPDAEFVYEALRALFLIGEAEDIALVERYAEGVGGMPARIKEQAAQTAKAIRSRSAQKDFSGVKP